SGACGRMTVVVLPVSIAPVPRRIATITATTRPPNTPASRFALPFTTGDGRGARLIRRKTGVRRDREQAAQARQRAAAVRERAAQGAPVARGRRRAVARPRVALVAQQVHIPRGRRPGRDPQPPLELRQRRTRGVLIA